MGIIVSLCMVLNALKTQLYQLIYSCFGILVNSALSLKTRVDSSVAIICRLHLTGATSADLLVSSMTTEQFLIYTYTSTGGGSNRGIERRCRRWRDCSDWNNFCKKGKNSSPSDQEIVCHYCILCRKMAAQRVYAEFLRCYHKYTHRDYRIFVIWLVNLNPITQEYLFFQSHSLFYW